MNGFLSNPKLIDGAKKGILAKESYDVAECMMKERERRKEKKD